MTSTTISTDSAWQEALAIYALPEVANQLIDLQDDYGCNVNLLLLAIVIGNRQLALENEQIVRLVQSIEQSERQLAIHRELRRAAKQGPAAPYAQLKARELVLEQQQHALLLSTLNQFELHRVNTDAQAVLGLVLRYYAVPPLRIETTLRLFASVSDQESQK